jgi:hypothetical protein
LSYLITSKSATMPRQRFHAWNFKITCSCLWEYVQESLYLAVS